MALVPAFGRYQLPNIPAENILAEPAARNTTPCIAWACWCTRQKDADANMVVTPSDAIVMNTAEFKRVIENSLQFTKEDKTCPEQSRRIVTIGIKPNRPETGYGYLQASDVVEGEICKVEVFKEKPDAAAESLVYPHPADFGWSDLGNRQSLHEKISRGTKN